MKAIKFPQQTFILAENQPEYTPLPVHAKVEDVDYKDEQGKVHTAKDVTTELTACFQLDPDEIAQVVATGKIWYTQVVYGAQFQPIRMSVMNPFEDGYKLFIVNNNSDAFRNWVENIKRYTITRREHQTGVILPPGVKESDLLLQWVEYEKANNPAKTGNY